MLSGIEEIMKPWPIIRGSFPDLFRRYYAEMDSGVRHPSGYLILPTDLPTESVDKIGWLETGVKERVEHGLVEPIM